tara:strand:- start:379 stop:711 length:333 start_codon:yes stop_codon:yes gene_type:complete
MVKYLSIPINDASTLESDGNQIIQVLDLIMCKSNSTTQTIIDFSAPANGSRAIITHTAMAANDHSIRIAFTNAMAESMKTSYTSVAYPLNLNGINAADGSQVLITNILFE